MTDREIILESRIAELERRLEESCAQNVADNYLVPALSQEVDDLKARNAELVEALENIVTISHNAIHPEAKVHYMVEQAKSAIRVGKDV